MKNSSLDIARIGLGAAMVCIFSLITIPLPYGVPVTLQTFIIPYIAIMFGSKKGVMATVVYIALGMIGLPVFSGFTGGLAAIAGPTGGFILSFPLMAWIFGKIKESNNKLKNVTLAGLGMLVNYSLGLAGFMYSTKSSFYSAIIACVVPFILADVCKTVLAIMVGLKTKKTLFVTS